MSFDIMASYQQGSRKPQPLGCIIGMPVLYSEYNNLLLELSLIVVPY